MIETLVSPTAVDCDRNYMGLDVIAMNFKAKCSTGHCNYNRTCLWAWVILRRIVERRCHQIAIVNKIGCFSAIIGPGAAGCKSAITASNA